MAKSDFRYTESEKVLDLYADVAAGICYSQKLDSAAIENSTFDLSKVKKYIPKTKLPGIIQDILRESGYQKLYDWQHENKFISSGIHIEVLNYSIKTKDYCLVLMDGKEVKMTKVGLREWWNGRV